MQYIADTHIIIWWFCNFEIIPNKIANILTNVEQSNQNIGVSIISLWEISMLVEKNKIKYKSSLDKWFEKIQTDSIFEVIGINSQIILESSRFGEKLHKDPADRLIVATARCDNLKLLTCDERIINSNLVLTP